MTALEELTRAGLHAYDPLALRVIREPYGPDEIVFGSPAGPLERGEPGLPWHNCPVHQVGWSGPDGCWCCSDGVAAVKR